MIVRSIEVRQAARDDLVAHFDWFELEAGEDVAESMLIGASSAFDKLALAVGIGSPVEIRHPELQGLRKWRVSRFPNLLIFYQFTDTMLFIVRVLHASQDWLAALEGE